MFEPLPEIAFNDEPPVQQSLLQDTKKIDPVDDYESLIVQPAPVQAQGVATAKESEFDKLLSSYQKRKRPGRGVTDEMTELTESLLVHSRQQPTPTKRGSSLRDHQKEPKKHGQKQIEKKSRSGQSPAKTEKSIRLTVGVKPVCKFWMEGQCRKSDACPFSHNVKPNKTMEQVQSLQVCKFLLRNSCVKADQCPFSHDLSKVPCRFFHLSGKCQYGEACRFSHTVPISEEQRKELFKESTLDTV